MDKIASNRPTQSRGYTIAMVAACPFPANHGSAASIREMSDTLSAMGHRVHIVTYAFGQEEIEVRRAKVHRTAPFKSEQNAKVGPSSNKFLYDFQLCRLLIRVIRDEKVDIIHAHNYEGALVGIMSKWITRRPLLYNAVNLMSDELVGYRFIRPDWLAHAIARLLDWFIPIFPNHITAVSPELRQWFMRHGVPEGKVDFVPAGIEPGLFDDPRPERFRMIHNPDGAHVVMYTGVLNSFQRIDYLLQAFAIVRKQVSHVRLLVVSPLVSERHEKELKLMAEELGISNFTTWISPHPLSDLASYLALADVTVVPRPDCPGHPVKLLNYMLAGKPAVCFAGSAKGVTHLHDAFIVRDHDIEALADGIRIVLQDKVLAAKLSANARETVLNDFDWRQICQRIERIYHDLVGRPRALAFAPGDPRMADAEV
ncbi:MAG: glycosyltransferase family 4 protein [Spartobacteria bacterium]